MNGYDAFLLVSFGGPESEAEIMPFLETVTRGRGVPRERLLEVAAHYHHVGGKSPINDHCRALLAALEPAFREAGIALPLYWGNRNSAPWLADTIARMRDDGARRALAFTTSSFSSYSSCRQYLENLAVATSGTGVVVDKLRQHWNHPGYLEAVVARVRETLAAIPTERLPTARLVFTAHSIPMAMARTSRYAAEVAELSALVASSVGLPHEVAYQSRSGPPSVPWLEPDIGAALRALVGVTDVVVVPIGFTSDHMEVVWDLDHDAAAVARELGLGFHRAPTAGTHPAFVGMIVDLVRERLQDRLERPVVGESPACPDVCAPDCCAYQPRRPDTLA